MVPRTKKNIKPHSTSWLHFKKKSIVKRWHQGRVCGGQTSLLSCTTHMKQWLWANEDGCAQMSSLHIPSKSLHKLFFIFLSPCPELPCAVSRKVVVMIIWFFRPSQFLLPCIVVRVAALYSCKHGKQSNIYIFSHVTELSLLSYSSLQWVYVRT